MKMEVGSVYKEEVIMSTVYFDSMGPSGNIYAVLSLCKESVSKKELNELAAKVFSSKSYEEALSRIREYVDLIDVSGRYNG